MAYEEISEIPQKQKEFDLLSYKQFWNKSLKVYLQNVWKNRSLIETLLKTHSSNKEEDIIVGTPNHLNSITFSKLNTNNHDHSRFVTYINICLTTMWFSLRRDILNYKDIYCFFSSIMALSSLWLIFIQITTIQL